MPPSPDHLPRQRLALWLGGQLQGVGCRPTIARLALGLGLVGWVRNVAAGVALEVEGPPERLEDFVSALPTALAPPARLDWLRREPWAPEGGDGFHIAASESPGDALPTLLPDSAPCPDCLRELFDPASRRYRHPFISCTACGPRYSIAAALPFDRAGTSMAGFALCPACQAEYRDPADRRFHAQTLCCPDCGPRLWLAEASGVALPGEPLAGALETLRAGGILALKGVGGYQLLVDARDEAAVARLRRRKQRPWKPMAVLVRDLSAARALADVDDAAAAELAAPHAPILLLPRILSGIAPSVAPDTPLIGLMLPASPLHHLLLALFDGPLVCTSGNLSGAPLCIDDAAVFHALGGIADRVLGHDRPILQRLDDSVAQWLEGRPQLLRRARGLVPAALPTGRPLGRRLAMGGQHGNTLAIGLDHALLLSPPHGDLDHPEALQALRQDIDHHRRLYRFAPEAVLHDLHPDYASTREAEALGLPRIAVPHHLAHVAALMAEHRLTLPLLGIAWDGLGLGEDGSLCGGECYMVDEVGPRLSHRLLPFPLPGGDRAAQEPRRALLGLLYAALGPAALEHPLILRRFADGERALLGQMLARGLNCPEASSAGRLFDGVASLLDLRQQHRFEGDAAMQLQFAAETWVTPCAPYPCPLENGLIDWRPMLLEMLASREPVGCMARRFHLTLATAVAEIARETGMSQVVLGGGCFQNRLLVALCRQQLALGGRQLHWPQQLPAGDGGLAAGQLMAVALGWRHL